MKHIIRHRLLQFPSTKMDRAGSITLDVSAKDKAEIELPGSNKLPQQRSRVLFRNASDDLLPAIRIGCQ